MKISELLERLGELQGKHGDVDVIMQDDVFWGPQALQDVYHVAGVVVLDASAQRS